MSKATPILNDTALQDLLIHHDGYVAIAFLAFDSIPCDHFKPELKALSEAMVEWVKCYQMEVNENPTIVDELRVLYVPTVLLFKGGKEIHRWEGPYTHEALQERIRAQIRKTV